MKSTKYLLSSIVLLAMVLVFSVQVNAALDLIGQGTSAHGTYNLIYDTDLDVTWYDYTNLFTPFENNTWQNQVDWANALSVTFGGTTFNNWRLPTALNQDGSAPCQGFNCTDSEMGHLFYTELGNEAQTPPPNYGDFQHMQTSAYWTSTDYAPDPSNAVWVFNMYSGSQGVVQKSGTFNAIAVHSGNLAVVPEPISSTLFIVGGATLGFRRFRKQFKK